MNVPGARNLRCAGGVLSNMPVTIRTFHPDDQDAVVRHVLAIQNDEFDIPVTAAEQPDLRDVVSHYLYPGGNFWVAAAESGVVGTIGLLNIGAGDVALRKMFVAPAFRGREHAVGARLLGAATEWATRSGFRRILLGTVDQFQAAQRFYEKHGFTVILKSALPDHFPRMRLDTRFYQLPLVPPAA